MAKRLTDTEKWDKGWFCDLKPTHKLLWLYLLDKCDNAGFWDINMRLLNFNLDSKYETDDILKSLNGKVCKVTDKLWVPKFIPFQYPRGLQEANKAHKSVIDKLAKNNISYSFENMKFKYDVNCIVEKQAPTKPLSSPLLGVQELDKDKDMDIVVNNKDISFTDIDNFNSLIDFWNNNKAGKKYKNNKTKTMALNKLIKLSDNNFDLAKEAIEDTIANNYQGFDWYFKRQDYQAKNNTPNREPINLSPTAIEIGTYWAKEQMDGIDPNMFIKSNTWLLNSISSKVGSFAEFKEICSYIAKVTPKNKLATITLNKINFEYINYLSAYNSNKNRKGTQHREFIPDTTKSEIERKRTGHSFKKADVDIFGGKL